MIDIKGLDHVVLCTSDMPAMLHFYCDILGCQHERSVPEANGLVQLRAGNALIDLVQGGSESDRPGINMAHFCVQIAPREEADLLAYLAAHQVECGTFSERFGAQGFARSVYIRDPQGNQVELTMATTGELSANVL